MSVCFALTFMVLNIAPPFTDLLGTPKIVHLLQNPTPSRLPALLVQLGRFPQFLEVVIRNPPARIHINADWSTF
jgi:hypothetical protein